MTKQELIKRTIKGQEKELAYHADLVDFYTKSIFNLKAGKIKIYNKLPASKEVTNA